MGRALVFGAALILSTVLGSGGPIGEIEQLQLEEEDSVAASTGLDWLLEGSNRIDLEGEALIGSDITVLRSTAAYEHGRGDFTVGVTLGYTDLDIDYSPGAVTFPSNRSESNREAQLDLGWEVNPNLELTALARTYDGYPDYRTVWIAEYYRQFIGFIPGYQDPNPKGWAGGLGAVWDVVPGATRLTFSVGYGEDDIVQGWSFGPGGLEASRGRLDTISGAVVWEQALNGWLKTENSFRIQEVTAREPRFQVQSSWAVALGADWTVRATAGATRERPNFEAYYAGGVVDYEFLPGWHVSAHGRYYEDTGEIESSGFSTAAPGLQSFELGASLLYDKGDVAVRLYGGFYNTDFEPLNPTNVIFGDLYGDRDWWVTRLAISYSF